MLNTARQLLLVLLLVPCAVAQFGQQFTYIRITPPDAIQSLQGFRQKLRCDASYLGDPAEVTWYKNDAPILETNGRYIIDDNTNWRDTAMVTTLTILKTRVSDSGRYTCRMNPPGRSVTTVLVTVFERPAVKASQGQIMIPDENTTLSCQVLPALANLGSKPKMFWHKEGRFIGTRGLVDVDRDGVPDVNIDLNGNLTIINSKPTLGGTYTCRIRYTVYQRYNYVSADMKVYVNTSVRTEPHNWYNINSRRPLRLRCTAKGFPYAQVSWSYQGVLIRGGDMRNNISLHSRPLDHVTVLSTLTIRELPGKFNVTHFTCTGRNQFGTDQQVAAVVNTREIFSPFGSEASTAKLSAILCCLSLMLGVLFNCQPHYGLY